MSSEEGKILSRKGVCRRCVDANEPNEKTVVKSREISVESNVVNGEAESLPRIERLSSVRRIINSAQRNDKTRLKIGETFVKTPSSNPETLIRQRSGVHIRNC